MEKYPLLTELLETGAVIEHESYFFDEFDADGEYRINGKAINAALDENGPLLNELWNADLEDALVWESIANDIGYKHVRLVEFHTGD